ncbi:hypothetical protein BRX43_18490 [Sphingomonas sp. S-NIH.Pt15_0812]|nr:hypothetical protein BRX43_18490 [Sphingomonas sp. S-NIH.Pt15_0812]
MEAIRQLRRRYAFSMEAGRLEGLDDVFAPHAQVIASTTTMSGLPAIKVSLEAGCSELEAPASRQRPFAHALVRHDIHLAGDGTASGRCYVMDLGAGPISEPETAICLKAFRDEYRRIDGKWRITQTVIEPV